MNRPNLNKIIEANKDKTGHIPSFTNRGLGQYKFGGGMFPHYHSYAPPRMDVGGPSPGYFQNYLNQEEDETKKAKDWYNQWYTQRAKNPKFTSVANKRLKILPKLNVLEDEHLLNSLEAYGIYNYSPNNYDIVVDASSNPIGKQAQNILHEFGHAFDNLAPQKNRQQILEQNDLTDPYNNAAWGAKGNKADQSEMLSRLDQFRMEYKIDPNKDYTVEEMKKIIDEFNSQNPSIKNMEYGPDFKFSIRQLFDMLKNDPEKLRNINRDFVMSKPSSNLSYGKYGGDISLPNVYPNQMVPRFGPGGQTIDGCPPGFNKNPFGQCVNASGQTPDQAADWRILLRKIAHKIDNPGLYKNPLATPFKTRDQEVRETVARTHRQNYRLGEFGNQAFVQNAPSRTPYSDMVSQKLKQEYVSTHPYAKMENEEIERKYSDRNTEGVPDYGTRAYYTDRGLNTFAKGMEYAGYATGVGSIGSNLLRLSATGLEGAIGRNLLSRNLKNFTGRINPTLNAIDEVAAYSQLDPVGIMGNRLNARHYNPTTALNTSNNTITGLDRNLKNSAIEGADLVLGQNNLQYAVGAPGYTVTRQPINYWDMPGFNKKNPGFSPQRYINTANKFGNEQRQGGLFNTMFGRGSNVTPQLRSDVVASGRSGRMQYLYNDQGDVIGSTEMIGMHPPLDYSDQGNSFLRNYNPFTFPEEKAGLHLINKHARKIIPLREFGGVVYGY